MAKGLFTQGMCILLRQPVSLPDLIKRLGDFELVGQHESIDDDGPANFPNDDPPDEPAVLPLETTAIPEQTVEESLPKQQPTYSADDFRHEIEEGPHAALHAKLRSLRREHPNDSIRSK